MIIASFKNEWIKIFNIKHSLKANNYIGRLLVSDGQLDLKCLNGVVISETHMIWAIISALWKAIFRTSTPFIFLLTVIRLNMEIIILDLFSESFASYVSASSTPGVVRTEVPPLIELVTKCQSIILTRDVPGRWKPFGMNCLLYTSDAADE